MKVISRGPILDLSQLLVKGGKMSYPFEEHQTYFFGYGRVALLQGLKILEIKTGDNVLIPSYICNVVLAPLNYLGIRVKYFEVDSDLQPKLDQIENMIDHKTKAILAVNYFGFPTLTEEIRAICRKKNLFFIEDNAHGFLSKVKDKPLGTFGDISIFSIRKTLAVPNGATLVINNEELTNKSNLVLKNKGNDLIFFLRQLNRNLEFFTGINPAKSLKKLFGVKYPVLPIEESPEEEKNIKKYFIKQSRLADLMIKRINASKIAATRRAGFNYWLKNLPEGEPIFKELPEGIVPYVFPVRTKDREGFIKRMLTKGVECFTWPTLPSDLKEYPDFYKQTVVIPLWRNYGSSDN